MIEWLLRYDAELSRLAGQAQSRGASWAKARDRYFESWWRNPACAAQRDFLAAQGPERISAG